MGYWDIISDPWDTVSQTVSDAYDTAYEYTPWRVGQRLGEGAAEYVPSQETILETIDDYTYTPWEMADDISEKALEILDPRKLIPALEIDWTRVALFGVAVAAGGAGLLWILRR